ncbi:MAG: hypothetical protein ACXWES_05175 [Solirubrobacterales bacterium]
MRRIGVLFMVGSACVGLASVPGISSLVPEAVVAGTYFVGSLFFTAAALLQWRTRSPARIEWWASFVQLAGTLLFNAETLDAFIGGLSPQGEDLVVWGPDAFGSACFLIASALAYLQMRRDVRARGERIGHGKLRDDEWWISALNLLGSVGFGLSALAAYVVPDTGEFADAAAVTTWTLAGSICFFIAAYLLAERTDPAPDAQRAGSLDPALRND